MFYFLFLLEICLNNITDTCLGNKVSLYLFNDIDANVWEIKLTYVVFNDIDANDFLTKLFKSYHDFCYCTVKTFIKHLFR